MRYSINPLDPGYPAGLRARQAGQRLNVYLDGFLLSNVLMADEEAGTAKRYRFDAGTGQVIEEYLRGAVRVEVDEDDRTQARPSPVRLEEASGYSADVICRWFRVDPSET